MSQTENGEKEEIQPNNNLATRQKGKHQCQRPEFPITENYIKAGAGFIKNKHKLYGATNLMLKLQGTFRKS